MVQGINSLIGSTEGYSAVGGDVGFGVSEAGADRSPLSRRNVVTDGTELYVAGVVLIALAILILFRLGGFQAIIATK